MSRKRPLVGWYVHHHGAGHLTRFAAVRAQLDADVVVFSSLAEPRALAPATRWVVLPTDNEVEYRRDSDSDTDSDSVPVGPLDPALSDPDAGGMLHWAPIGHRGHARRLGLIAEALQESRFDAFVVDVSVEVTLLVRLFGIATIVMTQPGERADEPHQLAFGVATRIIAPWPNDLYVPRALTPFRDKTQFVGGVSRFSPAALDPAEGAGSADAAASAAATELPTVLVIAGLGGSGVTADDIEAAAAASSGWRWQALGMEPTEHVWAEPWRDNPFDLIARADVVVSWAGQNAVADLAATASRAIIVPQARPFDEQLTTADVLERARLAIVRRSWPAATEWPGLLAEAAALEPRWSAWQTTGAARRAAGVIEDVAAGVR